LRQFRGLIAAEATQLAVSSASARQRPVLEALTAEVIPLAEACRFLERNAARILSARRLGRRGRPLWLSGVQSEIHREPLGVVLIIGPGNYPLLLPGVQMVQALVAGNAVLLKPGIGGMKAASALHQLILRAGFDPKLVALLAESAEAALSAITARPDKVLFTGSAVTGGKILAQLAPLLIPATMELSGSDAVIVRPDADLDLTVKALRFALLLNGGATCIAPKRVFVHHSIATVLEKRLTGAFSPAGDRVRGPVSPARERLRLLIQDALNRGAHLLAGNEEAEGAVILGRVDPCSKLLEEDVFAPVLAVVPVADDGEAVFRANSSPFGLAASIFSKDEPSARRLAEQINAGSVTINDLVVPTADARVPFGGRRRSGFGVTRGAEGLLELTTAKVVTVSRGQFRPAFNLAEPGDEAIFSAYVRLAHGGGLQGRWAALLSLFRSLPRRSKSDPDKNK
jgi:acyl-CoA reductase-like NAD-dependent aldehyde dehydrogenase